MAKSFKDLEDGRSKQAAWVCVMDAKKRNAENIKLFTPTQIAAGEAFLQMAQNAWFRSRVYRNYRETNFIAIKVDKPTAADKLSPAVTALDNFAVEHGIEKCVRATSYIYRIAF